MATRPAPETASSGIVQVDALTGGLPADASPKSAALILLTHQPAAFHAGGGYRREEICTLIDASDAFDPHSAAAAGVNLEGLLWVRCGVSPQSSSDSSRRRRNAQSWRSGAATREDPVEQALRATDLLLQSSGFGMVVIDLPACRGRRLAVSRLRRGFASGALWKTPRRYCW